MTSNSTERTEWTVENLTQVRDRTTDVDRRNFMKATGAAAILGGLPPRSAAATESVANAKTRPTIWTEEMRENARRNIERYGWATSERDGAVTNADAHLDRFDDLDELWHYVPAQTIPRCQQLTEGMHWNNRFYGSWNGLEREWKMTDGEYVVPTNDFAAYRESGLDDEGKFDPALADDQYLVNEEHPEMGEGWGVDDGHGWVDEDGELGEGEGARFMFAAYYNHWAVWRPGGILRIVRALSKAHLYTGDRKYSRAGTVLLDRIADVYPEMNLAEYPGPRAGGVYPNPVTGGRGTGRVIGSHWEPNLVRDILRAYDSFFPGQESDDELVSFLDAKTEEYPGLGKKSSLDLIRKNIEDGFVREMLPAAKNSQIVLGRGQLSALAISARVLDEPDGYTRDAIEFIFQPGQEIFTGDVWYEEPENWHTTGGNVLSQVVDTVDRDGYFHETAPLYNGIRLSSVRKVADILQGYDGFDGADLYGHPKFPRMLRQNSELLLLDRYTPELGDTHVNRNYVNGTSIEKGFEVYGEPIYAQLWYYLNSNSTAGIRGDIFSADPEALGEDVQAIIDAEGPLDVPSVHLTDYGFTALRDGENYKQRDYGGVRHGFLSLPIVDSSTGVKRYDDRGYIQLEANEPGEHITFEFEVPATDAYALEFNRYEAISYGVYEVIVDGEKVGEHDFYAPNSGPRNEFLRVADDLDLEAGSHTITFRNVGRHEDSTNYKFAVYQLQLLDEEARRRKRDIEELGNAKRATWLYYGRNNTEYGTSHTHRDTLNLGMMAYELDLMPDLGYPEQTGGWPKRRNWTDGTVSHNSVVVDAENQHPSRAGTPLHYDGEDDRVQLVDVEASDAYPQTDAYRRTTAMVEVDERDSYAVDFFRIAGGDDHCFSFHGANGSVAGDGVALKSQNGGTYAGPDVPKPGYGEDTQYNEDVGNGFNYLDAVERDDDPDRTVALDWDVEDHWDARDDDADVHLRLTTFGEVDEVALADGHPPQREGNPESLRYALLRRRGSDLETTFTSVVEPYEGERFVEAISEVEAVPEEDGVDSDARALKIELTTGRTDYVVCAFDDETYVVDGAFRFRGFFGVYAVEGGEPEYAYVNDGRLLQPVDEQPLIQRAYGGFDGTVDDFTREMTRDNEIVVNLDGHVRDAADAVGEHVVIETDEPENAVYPIEDVTTGRGTEVTLGVGDRTTVKQFANPDELADGGYDYYFETGTAVSIPLSDTWVRE